MANTLVVDDSSVAALNYFDSSFAMPIYDSRMTDTYYESFFPVSGMCVLLKCLKLMFYKCSDYEINKL